MTYRRQTPEDGEIEVLRELLDQSYDRKAWHGTNLRGSIRGLSPAEAAWRPAPGRHNIWEIVTHAAYWKYVVRRRLLGEKRGSFPLPGSNWFVRPAAADRKSWLADIALLADCHRQLCDAIGGLRTSELRLTPPGSKVSNLEIILGIASHDLYHAGQIQLLKRLQRSKQA
jgi:hypothetical protein